MARKSLRTRALETASGLALGALLSAGPVFAQQVETITVTAERREQSLQDVPVAVTAMSAQQLELRGVDEPINLVEFVPNMIGTHNTGIGSANAYYIRGLGNTETIATFDPPVGTYIDEVFIARQNANNIAFFDVDRIEVLRGPQGTLFGRNTTGGAVSVFMRQPAAEFGGFAEAGIGSYGRYLARGSVDMPVNERFLTKLSAYWIDEDGYVDNVTTGDTLNAQEGWGVRLDLTFLPSDTVRWDVALGLSDDGSINIANYVEGQSPLAESSGSGQRISRTGLSARDCSDALLTCMLAGQGLGLDNEAFEITSNLAVDAVGGTFNFITGYRNLDQRFIVDFFDGGLGGQGYATGGFVIGNEAEHSQFSQEVKFTGSFLEDRVDVVAGAYYFTEDNSTLFIDTFTIGAPPGIPLVLANRTLDNTQTSVALYSQFDFHITDRLTLTAGARWTNEEKEIELRDNRAAPPPGGALTTASLLANGIPDDLTTSLITPRFAAQFQLNDDVMLFASYTQGFKSGGWNARGTTPTAIQPFFRELATNWEAGVRSVLFDNRVRLNATAFLLEVEDYQAPSAFNTATGIQFITLNDAGLRNTGFEVEADIALVDNLNIFAAIGRQNAEYTDPSPRILQQQADCIAGLPNSAGQGIVTPGCGIAVPVRAPDWTVTLGGNYYFELPGSNFYIQPAANARWQSDQWFQTSNLPASFTDSVWLVNAGVTVGTVDRDWALELACNNCTDEIYGQSLLAGVVYINPPRRWSLELRRNF